MTQQPEALKLATVLENKLGGAADEDIEQAAAELRRLHEANEAFGQRQEWWNDKMFDLEARITTLEAECDRLQKEADREIARVDPLVARVVVLERVLRQAVDALEGVATWVEQRPKTHPWDTWQRVDPAITTAKQALEGTQPRQWQGLTFSDIEELGPNKEWIEGARWAEAKLREKNA